MAACRHRITTLDISRESALNEGYIELITWREIALVQYNSRCEFILIDSVMAECNMSCSEEKSNFADRECFPLKEKEQNLITELINRHGETCKQVTIIQRIKQTKNNRNNFLKEEQQFWSRNWALDEVRSFKLVNMLPSFFHRNCSEAKYYSWYFQASRINKWHRLENKRIQRMTV